MKTSHLSDAVKILILVSAVIVACVLCAVGFKMINEGKSAVNASTNNLNDMSSQYQDVDIAIYDGADVQGSEVVNLIKKTTDSDKYLAIGVLTLRKKGADTTITPSDYTYYNKYYTDAGTALADTPVSSYAAIENDDNPESLPNFINSSAQFSGDVLKDENGLVICVLFTQKE
jgi:hypothetical protein